MSGSVDDIIRELQRLEIRQRILLGELSTATANERQARGEQSPRASTDFAIGDRVVITNNVPKKPLGRNVTTRDRRGTVYKITEFRVFLKTDNGNKTNRARHNLRHVNNSDV